VNNVSPGNVFTIDWLNEKCLQRWGDMALLLLPWMGLWPARSSPLIPLGPTLCTLYGKREIKEFFFGMLWKNRILWKYYF
jgi:hypothetical protein